MVRTALASTLLALAAQVQADSPAYPTNDCVASLHQDARLLEIVDKVALGRSDETSEAMLALDRPATAAERGALALWSKLREFCFELGAEFRRAHADADQAALAGRLFALQQGLLGELRAGLISFAEFNRRRVATFHFAAAIEGQIMERLEEATLTAHEV